jgi:hypothetical protein
MTGTARATRPQWRLNLPGRWRFKSPLQQTQVPGRPDKREEMADDFVAGGQFSVADITAVVAVDFARVVKFKPGELALPLKNVLHS